MNEERIKELLLEAGWAGYEALDERNQKFAELIVRECLSIAQQEHKNALEFDWDNDDTAKSIRDSISEHFGVEE